MRAPLSQLDSKARGDVIVPTEGRESAAKIDSASVLFEIGLVAALMLLVGLISELAVRFGS